MNYSNLGVAYKAMDSTDTALRYYLKSLELAEELGSPMRLAQNYLNIGNIYKERREYSRAEEYLRKALAQSKKSGIRYGEVLSYINLGENHYFRQDYSSAIPKYDSALTLAEQMGIPGIEYQIHEYLFDMYSVQEKYIQAIINLNTYHALQDSIESAETRERVRELQIRYETAKTEQENNWLRQEKSIQKKLLQKNQLITLLVGFLLLIVLLSLILVYRSRSRISEANKLLEHKNRELESILARVKYLQGLLPICSNCKKIRNDEGYWQEVESYISDRSDAMFSHGICPDCIEEPYSGHERSGEVG